MELPVINETLRGYRKGLTITAEAKGKYETRFKLY